MSGFDDLAGRISAAKNNPPKLAPVKIRAGRDAASRAVARAQARVVKAQLATSVRQQAVDMLRKR